MTDEHEKRLAEYIRREIPPPAQMPVEVPWDELRLDEAAPQYSLRTAEQALWALIGAVVALAAVAVLAAWVHWAGLLSIGG
jgi:hypothetical protein